MNFDSFTSLPSLTLGAMATNSFIKASVFPTMDFGGGKTLGLCPRQVHQGAALLERVGGSFQHLHHTQAGDAVVERSFVFPNALDEVRQFLAQRLYLFDLRRPHVARTVAHQ